MSKNRETMNVGWRFGTAYMPTDDKVFFLLNVTDWDALKKAAEQDPDGDVIFPLTTTEARTLATKLREKADAVDRQRGISNN